MFQQLTQHSSALGGEKSALAGSYTVSPVHWKVLVEVADGLAQVGLKTVTSAVSLTTFSEVELRAAVLVQVPVIEPVAVSVSFGNDPPTFTSRQSISCPVTMLQKPAAGAAGMATQHAYGQHASAMGKTQAHVQFARSSMRCSS